MVKDISKIIIEYEDNHYKEPDCSIIQLGMRSLGHLGLEVFMLNQTIRINHYFIPNWEKRI